MNREILFRGKDENGNWHEGDLVHDAFDGTSKIVKIGIMAPKSYPVEVKPETVGQFTGRTDEFNVRIFENDIVLYAGAKGVVFYDSDSAMFMVKFEENRSRWSFDSMDEKIEVIGMIDDLNFITDAN